MDTIRITILNKLKDIFILVKPNKDLSDISEESRLIEDLGLNSIGLLYIIISIEELFKIKFENIGVTDFKTIKDVIDYIESKINKNL